MKRKEFIKKSLTLGAIGTITGKAISSKEPEAKIGQVGFNHIPLNEEKTMNTVLHKSDTRGLANHGWLKSYHSFSFSNFYNPERMNFGALRVLNDDQVAASQGFGRHPHDNMEIISIPLSGDLEHEDSMGNKAVIKEGDVQVMSAGTGIFHSEYNKNSDKEVKFLQIWVIPKNKGVEPRYDQVSIRDLQKKNEFYQVVSPNADDVGVWVHQDAWFHLGEFDENTFTTYKINKEGNGLYAFILEGKAEINGQKLDRRDGYGIWDFENVEITTSKGSRILLMEVPMKF